MILVDTSIWVDHFRRSDPALVDLLTRRRVLTHPFVIGELALGGLTNRKAILGEVIELPRVTIAEDDEVLSFIGSESLAGTGIGYVDAHLLASVRLAPGAMLWTRDRRLADIAERLSQNIH